MTKSRQKAIQSSRLGRLGQLGGLAAGMATSTLYEGLRRWQRGESWHWQQQALTPNNLARLNERLSEMRGAAMKLGQLLSMDAGHLLPPELAQLLASLRKDAHTLPLAQLEPLLTEAWGSDWPSYFQRFSYHPLASASIGQVHQAVTKEGQQLAIKIQYPGVSQSIDSDLDNVATLLRWSRLLPKQLDIHPILEEAKIQLQLETDYANEAQQLALFRKQLEGDERFLLPEVNTGLTRHNILAMSLLPGQPLEQLIGAPMDVRQKWCLALFELFFAELFDFNLIQTDPNFANYLIDLETQRLGLIDFGAVRAYPKPVAEAFRQLLQATLSADDQALLEAATQLGYVSETLTEPQRVALVELFQMAAEPLTQPGPYDFAHSSLPDRLRQAGMRLSLELGYWQTPPVALLLLHRKLGGLFLLAQQLRVQLDVTEVARPYLSFESL